MSNGKALSNSALELTQKIQMHFPRDIDPEVLRFWNGCSKEIITAACVKAFAEIPVNFKEPSAEIVIPLLDFSGEGFSLPAIGEAFEAAKHFIVNTAEDAEVKICGLWGLFEEEFLGKTEAPFVGSVLYRATLTRSSFDGPIIDGLGGTKKAEVALAEFFAMLKRQRSGQVGALLTNGYANIFYIKNKKGVLRTVYARWYAGFGGWYVFANAVTDPRQWRAGFQVFSRSSRLASAA